MRLLFALMLLCASTTQAAAAAPVLYCFTADWCAYCHQMQPVLDRLKQDGHAVEVVNRDHQPQLAAQMGVRGLPYFVVVSDGRIVDQLEGATSYGRLVQMISAASPQLAAAGRGTMQQGIPTRQAPIQTTRAQSPSSASARNAGGQGHGGSMDVRQRAMQASVKLRVDDSQSQAYGSGTIVHVQGGEALVLTCAHLFRDTQGQGPIEVILYNESSAGISQPGKLLRYDLERDVALVSVQTRSNVVPVPLASETTQLAVGDAAFSVGCDHGGERNLYPTRIKHINRYMGPANVEAVGAPAVGRSGGGLFSADGQLIGICNCADDEDDEGIYAALPTIHEVVRSADLAHLFSRPMAVAQTAPGRSATSSNNFDSNRYEPAMASLPRSRADTSPNSTASGMLSDQTPSAGLSAVEQEVLRYLQGQKQGAEVTIVVRSKGNPSAQPAVFRMPENPSPEFLRQAASHFGSGAIVRGQSR